MASTIHQSRSQIAGLPENPNTLWSASDRGDVEKVRELLLTEDRDVNARNCLGCTPLLYACGSGHVDTVRLLLTHTDIDVNRRNNDRLTSFMLAMQGGALAGRIDAAWAGWDAPRGSTEHGESQGENAQEKMKRLMDLPATDDLEWTRHDRWTALMEACNFGHKAIVELLLCVPNLDLEAVNLRGQRAEEVAASRGHDSLVDLIRKAKEARENPEELPRIQELEKEVATLKLETRQRLAHEQEQKYLELRKVKADHEMEIEPLSLKIDLLQTQLEEAMKQRLAMITRQVREIKNKEEEIRQVKRKIENFDRYAGSTEANRKGHFESSISSGLTSSNPNLSVFGKDFECSVCLEDMRPPTKIFQCRNGHVMCEACKSHPDVLRCPSCRIQLHGEGCHLMRNLPMEKLALSYFGRSRPQSRSSSRASRRASAAQIRPIQVQQPEVSPSVRPSRRGSGALAASRLSQSSETAFLEWLQ